MRMVCSPPGGSPIIQNLSEAKHMPRSKEKKFTTTLWPRIDLIVLPGQQEPTMVGHVNNTGDKQAQAGNGRR